MPKNKLLGEKLRKFFIYLKIGYIVVKTSNEIDIEVRKPKHKYLFFQILSFCLIM